MSYSSKELSLSIKWVCFLEQSWLLTVLGIEDMNIKIQSISKHSRQGWEDDTLNTTWLN